MKKILFSGSPSVHWCVQISVRESVTAGYHSYLFKPFNLIKYFLVEMRQPKKSVWGYMLKNISGWALHILITSLLFTNGRTDCTVLVLENKKLRLSSAMIIGYTASIHTFIRRFPIKGIYEMVWLLKIGLSHDLVDSSLVFGRHEYELEGYNCARTTALGNIFSKVA